MKKSGLAILIIFVALLLLFLATGIFGLWYWYFEANQDNEEVKSEDQETEKGEVFESSDLKLENLTVDNIGISLQYPKEWGKADAGLTEFSHPFYINPGDKEKSIIEGLGYSVDDFRNLDDEARVQKLKEKNLFDYINRDLEVTFSENPDFLIGGQNKNFRLWELYERKPIYGGTPQITKSSCEPGKIEPLLSSAGINIFDLSNCEVVENEIGLALRLMGIGEDVNEQGGEEYGLYLMALQAAPENKKVDGYYFQDKLKSYQENQEMKLLETIGTHGPGPSKERTYNNQCLMGGGSLGRLDFNQFLDREINDSFLKEVREYLRAGVLKDIPDLPSDRLNIVLDVAERHLERYKGKKFTNKAEVDEDNIAVMFLNEAKLQESNTVKTWEEIEKLAPEKEITYADLQYLVCQVGHERMLQMSLEDIKKNQNRRSIIDQMLKSVTSLK